MTNCFHLAIPAGNIKTALKFYCDILGCKTGNQEEGRWIDINFWGNELTLHETKSKQFRERHDVDMGDVCVPHFGVHLEESDFEEVKRRIEASPQYGRLGTFIQSIHKRTLFLRRRKC